VVYVEAQTADPDRAEGLLADALAVAEALRAPGGHAGERLARIAEADPRPEVRDNALRALLRSVPGPEASRLAGAALASDDPSLRLLGAVALGDFDALIALAGAADAEVRAEAIGALIQHDKLPRSLEPSLIDALGHRDGALRIAAIRALGVIGTARAVEPLLPLVRTGALAGDQGRAAGMAVRKIQSRLRGEAGGLSLVDSGEGAGGLALAGAEGALSAAGEE